MASNCEVTVLGDCRTTDMEGDVFVWARRDESVGATMQVVRSLT